MSSYRDPSLHGDVYPSEEEIDPTGVDPDETEAGPDRPGARTGNSAGTRTSAEAGPERTAPVPTPEPEPAPTPHPGPPPRDGRSRSIVTRHLDGSVEVVTDLDGDGVADVVQVDIDGDGVPDVMYLDSDRDGRLDTVRRA
ncbi:hypothetical protein O7602_05990 [Micromonospora sp. WMMD1128]|uniref:hypothetical protein n=1 Tax=unclassified Micromonospora TaxID=2617518 RepID=UPI00248D2536|nr:MULTISPECIES: hypothetical protein [unclassified Micromonospora]WBB75078.1 hypothetical protein O7602_05990 [Micromonospora sp. WMMD1128]WFE31546.1 hypothetical protein O7613_18195 [Micromonospora sp. WMMD975]